MENSKREIFIYTAEDIQQIKFKLEELAYNIANEFTEIHVMDEKINYIVDISKLEKESNKPLYDIYKEYLPTVSIISVQPQVSYEQGKLVVRISATVKVENNEESQIKIINLPNVYKVTARELIITKGKYFETRNTANQYLDLEQFKQIITNMIVEEIRKYLDNDYIVSYKKGLLNEYFTNELRMILIYPTLKEHELLAEDVSVGSIKFTKNVEFLSLPFSVRDKENTVEKQFSLQLIKYDEPCNVVRLQKPYYTLSDKNHKRIEKVVNTIISELEKHTGITKNQFIVKPNKNRQPQFYEKIYFGEHTSFDVEIVVSNELHLRQNENSDSYTIFLKIQNAYNNNLISHRMSISLPSEENEDIISRAIFETQYESIKHEIEAIIPMLNELFSN